MEDNIRDQVEETVSQPVEQESSKETNMRALRERAMQLQQKIDMMEQERLRYAQQQNYYQQPEPQKRPSYYDDEDEDDDGYVDKKSYKKMQRHIDDQTRELKETKSRLDEMHRYAIEQEANTRLTNKFKDFRSIVTSEAVDTLKLLSPDDYETIRNTPDMYTRGQLAYYAIKRNNFHAQEDDDSYIASRKIEDNKVKPKSSSSTAGKVNTSPDALANAVNYDGRRSYTSEDRRRIMENLNRMKRERGR